ncbi:hypothetical protein ACJQWK_01229 [Exserohilum turcicum]|uniref:Uncharacterized protein n=1 Tax=Exserohilum turcicum (strain 28A) TaxID=671987 RepID=R0K4A0_EXST2|nr:uncharacterized protein SETTUDRAFT_172818 [Exserohilum turcica Et28A]EOA84399.1 hypothetical protein SETTUDRAFT_172818 [Exserohilum turcica Et28A]
MIPLATTTLPRLDYSLRDRRVRIGIFWMLVFFDSVALPVLLYFILWYGTDLEHNIVFGIITAVFGGTAILEYFQRFWRLCKKNSTCRAIGARRFSCDWFQWNMTVAFVIIIVELVIGTLPKEPMVRVLAMPLPSLLAFFGLELSLLELMYVFHLHAPFRISSVARGENLRPAIYPLIEDIIAVDGDGGTAYRMRLNQRYEASPYFRLMLHRLSMFWALPALLMAVGTTYMIFSVRRDTAYVLGWFVPFIWSGIWSIVTTKWVQRDLEVEQMLWDGQVPARS